MKIGRNDPCPCGSGKKYKKCCFEKTISHKDENSLERVVQWVLQNHELISYYDSLLTEYFPKKVVDDQVNLALLTDAFIFEYVVPGYEETPFEIFLDGAKLNISEIEYYEKYLDNIFSLFEVLKVDFHQGIELCDFFSKKKYYTRERRGTESVKIGDIVSCRIAKLNKYYEIISPTVQKFSPETSYLLKRFIKNSTKINKDDISAFDFLDLSIENKNRVENFDDIRKALKNKVNSLGIKMNFKELDKRINENESPTRAFPEIFHFNFPSNEDYKETIELVHSFWNTYPRKEFGGKSPKEVSQYGPKEKLLIKSLITEGTHKIKPDEYSTSNDAIKALEKFKETWLNTPQKELGNKTPRDIILKERKMLGNTREDISLKIELYKIDDFNVNKAKKLYFDAIDAEKKGDSEISIKFLKEVIEIYPENYKAWGNMGASYASLGKINDAFRCLQKALLLKPNYAIAKKNLEALEKLSKINEK